MEALIVVQFLSCRNINLILIDKNMHQNRQSDIYKNGVMPTNLKNLQATGIRSKSRNLEGYANNSMRAIKTTAKNLSGVGHNPLIYNFTTNHGNYLNELKRTK